MAARRRRIARSRGRSTTTVSEPLLSYRTIVGATVAFCLVALLGMGSSRSFGVIRRGSGSSSGTSSSSSSSTSSSSVRKQSTVVFSSTESISDALLVQMDAILILGGGRPTALTEPPVYVQRRCNDAATLAQRYQALHGKSLRQGIIPILCLSAGTAHVPQLLTADGLPIWESTASAAYLLQRRQQQQQHHHHHDDGLDASQVYVETTSYDTIGNAFYARTNHVDWQGWRKLLIITNEFHMNRTVAIFDWIFGIVDHNNNNNKNNNNNGRPKAPQQQQQQPYQLYYLASANVGLTTQALQARREREQASLTNVQRYATQYTTLPQVYHFLSTQHGLYTASKLIERASQTTRPEPTDLVQQSYGATRPRRLQQQQQQHGRKNPLAAVWRRMFRS